MTKLFVCGDIVNQFSNCQFIGEQMQRAIKSADYSIGNFEGTLSFKEVLGKGMVQDGTTLDSLKDAGFSMLLLSNNHIGDYGYEGFLKTIQAIRHHGFDIVGAGFSYEEAYKPLIKEIRGKKFGFINVCEAICCLYKSKSQQYGCAWTGAKEIEAIIPNLKKEVDYVIIFPHSGLEHCDLPMEHTRELYRHYCDLGADCIIASHPHVPQGIEVYNDHYIFYSLGNFYFPESKVNNSTLATNNSYSVILTFEEGEISYELIYHKTESLVVEISSKPEKDIVYLSSILQEPEYSQNVKIQNTSLYEKEIFALYSDAIFGITRKRSFKDRLKIAIRLLRPLSDEHYNNYIKSFHKIIQSETYINLVDSVLK